MIAYFDCFSGISGDMTLGACIDLGLPLSELENMIQALKLEKTHIEVNTKSHMGIRGTQVVVHTECSPIRHYSDIRELIHNSELSDRVKELSQSMFLLLASVESHIHGCDIDRVHFHEVGAVDSIVDIIGTASAIEALDIDRIHFSPLPLGKGFVNCQHGRLPVPSPATLNILKNVPVYGTQVPYELVTPTGALFAACLAESYGQLPEMVIQKVGYGAGSRKLDDRPNLLRIILGNNDPKSSQASCESVGVIETHVDDMTPECLGYVMSHMMSSGALDVLIDSVHMKKNRVGHRVQVICRPSEVQKFTDMVLQETSSIGVRYQVIQRKVLHRHPRTIHTKLGDIQAKEIHQPDGTFVLTPEFESCKQLAQKHQLPVQRVYAVFYQEHQCLTDPISNNYS